MRMNNQATIVDLHLELIREHLEVCRKSGRKPTVNELRAACYWCSIEEVRRCLAVLAGEGR